jgi:hypothetical protein
MNNRHVEKKAAERWYVERFLRALLLGEAYSILDCERPDFLVLYHGNRIGLEHTELHWGRRSGPPRAELESLQTRIREEASKLWDSSPRPALHVWATLRPGKRVRKGDVKPLASALVAIADDHLPPPGRQLRVRRSPDWPEALNSLHIVRLASGKQSHWQILSSGFIPTLEQEYLQDVINAKNQKLTSYAENVSQQWLLISIEVGKLSMTFELPDATTTATYKTSFSRVFIFEPTTERIIELRTGGV